MIRHAHYPFWLHDDTELAELIDDAITNRETLHEWPLSCVQEIHTAGGGRFIYKVQAPPTLEADFYAKASSPLLIPVRTIETNTDTVAMIMNKIDAPRLSDLKLEENEVVSLAKKIVPQIGQIAGDLPVMIDIGSEDRFAEYINETVKHLQRFVQEGSFRKVKAGQVQKLKQWSTAAPLIELLNTRPGYVHGDLKADNILITEGDIRMIDWQRPLRGPAALDMATLLLSMNIDPMKYVPAGAVQLHHFLHIAWFTEAAYKWFPQGKPWFDGMISSMIRKLADLQE